MDQPIIFLLPAVLIIIIAVGYFFSKKAVIKRKLKKATYKSIGAFKDGAVAKIVGHVQIIDEPLIAPLSKRECAYYYVHIEQRVSSGKSSRWKTIIEEEVSSAFLIREEDHVAFINDTNLKCYIVQDRSFSSDFLKDASQNLERYLERKGYKSENFVGLNKTIRYKEGVLEHDEKIAVFAKGNWKDATSLQLPEKYDQVLEITSHENVAIYLSDDPDTTLQKAKKNDVLIQPRKSRHKQRYSNKD